MKKIYPLQAFGLGDIIFCQTLVRSIADQYKDPKIVWGTLPEYINGLRLAYPDIEWMDWTQIAVNYDSRDRYEDRDVLILPIRHAAEIMKVPYKDCMRAKYDMYGMPWTQWTNQAKYERDRDREAMLAKIVGIIPGEEFALVNPVFRSNQTGRANIPQPKIKTIEMRTIPGFSLFDWSGIIEEATQIHTVGTSINYIIELLDIKAPEVHLYKRLPDENHFINYDYLLRKHKYIFCQ